jgi:hypothetical protein
MSGMTNQQICLMAEALSECVDAALFDARKRIRSKREFKGLNAVDRKNDLTPMLIGAMLLSLVKKAGAHPGYNIDYNGKVRIDDARLQSVLRDVAHLLPPDADIEVDEVPIAALKRPRMAPVQPPDTARFAKPEDEEELVVED